MNQHDARTQSCFAYSILLFWSSAGSPSAIDKLQAEASKEYAPRLPDGCSVCVLRHKPHGHRQWAAGGVKYLARCRTRCALLGDSPRRHS